MLPVFNDKTGALYRRLILIPFLTVIAESSQNSHLVTELTAELPGILNWAINGLQRLLKQDQFTKCLICERAKAEHRLDCSAVAQFLEETVPLLPESHRQKMSTTEFHQRYRVWCETNGHTKSYARSFVQQLRFEGIKVWRSHGKRWCRPDGLRSTPLGVPS
jgi:putative DNA primase/helicase